MGWKWGGEGIDFQKIFLRMGKIEDIDETWRKLVKNFNLGENEAKNQKTSKLCSIRISGSESPCWDFHRNYDSL